MKTQTIQTTPTNKSLRKNFSITKKIAKHGSQAIIVIPRMLEYHLKPGMVVQLNIDVINDKSKEGAK